MSSTAKHIAFGNRFQEFLEKENVKRKNLAEELDISVTSISWYATGDNMPSATTVLNLMKMYPYVNWYYIIFGDGAIYDDMPLYNSDKVKVKSKVKALEKRVESLEKHNVLLEKNIELSEKLLKEYEDKDNDKD